jgi:hypothetical protein
MEANKPLPPGWIMAKKSPEIAMMKAMPHQREIRRLFLNAVFMVISPSVDLSADQCN